jgi:hypothetical protein
VLRVQFDQLLLLLGPPLLLVDAALEVVVVALAALLAVAPLDAVVPLHHPRQLAPLLHPPLLVQLLEDLVFLPSPTPTYNFQILRSLILPAAPVRTILIIHYLTASAPKPPVVVQISRRNSTERSWGGGEGVGRGEGVGICELGCLKCRTPPTTGCCY